MKVSVSVNLWTEQSKGNIIGAQVLLIVCTNLAGSLKIGFHTISVSGRVWILFYTLLPTSLFFSLLLLTLVSTSFSVPFPMTLLLTPSLKSIIDAGI